ncbi:sigma-54-dependent Fis family transcriptional regulator [Thermincola potens]|uniref:GAF modulated sigma54 specific transcriptional regulator, Fis family n=1 Tax=Thermincola potens (strain JR) TaxID=635013 RepID=D5XDY0_THEPJ|nr:sigma-54-dependent Fis family transcriptional regulator [Thermincola potens]ADG81851.1 GAF modulated sigma54 specific transcriptional regulator, Fis family [Thermincola potens JR]
MWTVNRKLTRVYRSWEKFISNYEIEPYVIRPLIANSWHRCLRMKVDPMSPLDHINLLSPSQINKHIERRKTLIGAAMPFMSHLYNFVKGSETLVCLADDNGIILDVLRDPVIHYQTKHICTEVGSDWSESICGTNSIGTCLFEKKPVQITATEHYCKVLHGLTGSAAPIFSPEGELLGVLSIIGLCNNVHAHTLGMVVAAVKAIENQLVSQKKSYELLLAYKKVTAVIETMDEGLIAIEANRKITQLNSEGAKILQVNREDCIGRSALDVFGQSFPLLEALQNEVEFTDKEFYIETPAGGTRFTSTVKMIRDETGQVTGMMATLREMQSVHKLVNKMVGAQATFTFDDIIGNDPQLHTLIQRAKRVARSSSTILLQGSSGTGKEMFAQAIHNASGRRGGPFIVINCGAIPRELVESELFGYEEGAFTGAKKGGRPGKFELASGGTIFLDEIGDMPLDIQASLLRVLQERQVTRIGGQKSIPVNTRVIAATNKNLAEEVEKGNFRLDLYYRLNVINLVIPSLRDRPRDIPYLAQYFVNKISRRLGITPPIIAPDFYECLSRYDWPGNVRELENVIEQALNIVETDILIPEHLPARIYSPQNNRQINPEQKINLKSAEAEIIRDALDKCRWNISRAASTLGIGRNTLYRKIKRYNLCSKRQKG